MSQVYSGTVFPVRTLTDDERAGMREELAWLEKDLIRRRAKLRYWAQRKHQAETTPDIPERLRQGAVFFHQEAVNLVNSGERLRSYLLLDLTEQPEHAAAYHYAQ